MGDRQPSRPTVNFAQRSASLDGATRSGARPVALSCRETTLYKPSDGSVKLAGYPAPRHVVISAVH